MFQLWLCKESVPVGLLVEGLLLVLGQGVPGEGVVDGAHHAAVGVPGDSVLSVLLGPQLSAQYPTYGTRDS